MGLAIRENVVDKWVAAFTAALDHRDIDQILDLFEPEGFWRDLAAFTWNLYTAEGHDAIRAMLADCLDATASKSWTVTQAFEPSNGVFQAVLTFETKAASCSAVLRLQDGRCWTLLTAVSELKGFEETVGARRRNGAPLRYERGRSGHDVSAQLWEAGSEITMIQRSPTIVIRMDSLLPGVEIFNIDAPGPKLPTELADLLVASIPNRLMPHFQAPFVAAIKAKDAAFYEGLQKAGSLYDFGEDGGGFFTRATQDPSGFYIDVGASELIIDGRIAVRSGVSVEAIRERSVILSDGAEPPADLIVYATGYRKLATLSEVLPDDIIHKLGPVGGIGSGIRSDHGPWEEENRNIWKPTRQSGLWLHNGNFGLMRFFSRLLALQIKARQVELPTRVYGLS